MAESLHDIQMLADCRFFLTQSEFCFLGAGALGTTGILLRSKKRGLQISPLVGRNLSGNGDLLVFGTFTIFFCSHANLIHLYKDTMAASTLTASPVNRHISRVHLDQQSLP
jgi:hypothetical protein